MRPLYVILVFSIATLSGTAASTEEIRLAVRHNHMIGGCVGELVFGENSVQYSTRDKEDERTWAYEEIYQVGLLSPQRISVLTYEDRGLHLGKDKTFNFELTQGEISASLWGYLQGRLAKPLVSAVLPVVTDVKYKLPVKHAHLLGGCQGDLEISDEFLIFKSRRAADSRIWRYEDLSSVGSTGLFQLRLTTLERVHGELGSEKNFVFDLKRRLVQDVYDFLWWKVNGASLSGRADAQH